MIMMIHALECCIIVLYMSINQSDCDPYATAHRQAASQAQQVWGLLDAAAEVVFSRKVAGESSSRIPDDSSAGTALECAVQLTDSSDNSECSRRGSPP